MRNIHSLPLGFSERRIIRNFSKSRPLQILKFLLELGRLGSQVILGILGFPPSCASFGTFGDFEEILLRARSARHVTDVWAAQCHPNHLSDGRCAIPDAWDRLVASQDTPKAVPSLYRIARQHQAFSGDRRLRRLLGILRVLGKARASF